VVPVGSAEREGTQIVPSRDRRNNGRGRSRFPEEEPQFRIT
jgi:hypothetical protein